MKLTVIAVSEPNKYPQIFRRLCHTSNLVLPVIAGLTPPEVNIELIDESVYLRRPDYSRVEADLVALSLRTGCANRAYEISDLFRSRRIPTVMGGIHPTVLPEESKQHTDAVVIGEAEPIWHRVIKDFQNGGLKPFYKADGWMDLDNLPIPRRDLLKYPNRALVSFPTIQTGRGCPYACNFCTVSRVYGGKYRKRPVFEIIRELEVMEETRTFADRVVAPLQNWLLFFMDDNLLEDRRYARELLTGLKQFGRRWYTQASVKVAGDPELLKLASESGCIMLAVGFESLSQKSIKGANKVFNQIGEYHETVRKIHDQGIMVGGSFVVGFDGDDLGVFEKTLQFTDRAGIDLASFHILVPYPGTPFFRQVEEEGRLLNPPGDWRKFDTQHVVFRPKQMTPQQLQDGFQLLWKEFLSLRSILNRGRVTANARIFWPLNFFQNGIVRSSWVRFSAVHPEAAS